MTSNKQTKPCPYCLCGITPAGFECVDCCGCGVRCILCGSSPKGCECGESRFDPVEQRQAFNEGRSF